MGWSIFFSICYTPKDNFFYFIKVDRFKCPRRNNEIFIFNLWPGIVSPGGLEIKADSATVESANAHLDSAKAYMEQKKAQEALAAFEASRLEYRLAMLRAERDSLKAEDERVEGELRADVERKLLYQNILDNENKEVK